MKASLNGAHGRIKNNAANGRWSVLVDGTTAAIAVKAENLEPQKDLLPQTLLADVMEFLVSKVGCDLREGATLEAAATSSVRLWWTYETCAISCIEKMAENSLLELTPEKKQELTHRVVQRCWSD